MTISKDFNAVFEEVFAEYRIQTEAPKDLYSMSWPTVNALEYALDIKWANTPSAISLGPLIHALAASGHKPVHIIRGLAQHANLTIEEMFPYSGELLTVRPRLY